MIKITFRLIALIQKRLSSRPYLVTFTFFLPTLFLPVLTKNAPCLPTEDFNQISSLWGSAGSGKLYVQLLNADAIRWSL